MLFWLVLSHADSSSIKLYMTGAMVAGADSGEHGEFGLVPSVGVLIRMYFNTSCSF
jgi:hypothetical protein